MENDNRRYAASLPDTLKTGDCGEVRFRVTENMIERFSLLTGDRSPLHTEKDFARRSMYRGAVAHGMLPIAFLSLLDFFNMDGYLCAIRGISGRFIEPVFAGGGFILRCEIKALNKDIAEAAVDFTIENLDSKAAATQGGVTVGYTRAGGAKAAEGLERAQGTPCMVEENLDVCGLGLEDISKGLADGFRFTIKDSSIAGLIGIISEGVEGASDVRAEPDGFYLPDLLSVLLFSTSVGMCIPGRYATFLEFKADIHRQARQDVPYVLKGEVSHVSSSTRMIKKAISVRGGADDAAPSLTGKVSVLVNQPSSKMASVEAIKNSALDMGLKGKVALITGASRGIGETTAKMFALHGSRVIVNYHMGASDAKRIVDELTEAGAQAVALGADVSDAAQVHEMIGRAVERFGAIDILVNNAVRDFRPMNFLKLSWEDIQKDLDVTAKGAFNCCKEVIPLMIERGGGKIINVSTVATDNPPANQTKYVVSKSALVGLTRSLAVEFASKNIQVNMVAPNFVETDLVSHINPAFRKKIAQDTPMRRNASPEDVARAIIFLASSYSSFTTGQRIMVTGGGPPYL